ncbi:sigma-54-dependent transcriptional regulator [Spirochaeta isovalerica]|uniref:Two-component system nitrogen regulation response regulator NtrX n=1 Tax=Spirochaeta isovalerica TaxID=150 RepID=A0A841RIF4_9SPIO|nr:sigma-54 dependent transcriptional regulator [Spirochaeta isovalerica]MBB6482308.1 two-component system nitrogen regulation response regulator NtrX [Spirochaeta isovalerica]
MNSILIIDDEPGIREILKDILQDEGYTVYQAGDGFEGLHLLKTTKVELVLLDIWLPRMGGIDVLKELKSTYPELEVIVISGHANVDMAVNAIKLGAFDFLEKPLDMDRVITLTRNALKIESLKQENKNLKNQLMIEDRMIGSSSSLDEVNRIIEQSAGSDSRVMITGENGTGKELVARRIHLGSNRRGKPFIEVNCAAIPDNLIESELFGHEKGAFTGASSLRKGKFEAADGGTLFLDEVADMSLSAQAKVLRAIQEMQFERVGGEQSIKVDVRILSATNKNIAEEIEKGKFREDLFFRLNVIPITLPPLRERVDDLDELVSYFMVKFKKEGTSPKTISPEGMAFLKKYPWPGNIRELKNFLERVNIMCNEQEISLESVQTYIGEHSINSEDETLNGFKDLKLNEAKDKFERELLVYYLKENNYNISKTAQVLGIYPSNLHSKIKKFDIEVKK